MPRLDRDGQGLVSDHLEVARRMARARWRRHPWIEMDDLIGVASYALCRAALSWKGRCPFELFAVQAIDHYLSLEVGRRWAARERTHNFVGDEEYEVAAPPFGEDGDMQAAFSRLADRDRDILGRVVIAGESFSEAGAGMGITKWAAVAALHTAKKRFRKLLAAPAAVPA